MKKLIASIIITLFTVVSAHAIDVTITIPNDKVDRVKTLFDRYPKIGCVSHPTGTPCTVEGIPTDLQHFKAILRTLILGELKDIDRDAEKKRVRAEQRLIQPVIPTDYEELVEE